MRLKMDKINTVSDSSSGSVQHWWRHVEFSITFLLRNNRHGKPFVEANHSWCPSANKMCKIVCTRTRPGGQDRIMRENQTARQWAPEDEHIVGSEAAEAGVWINAQLTRHVRMDTAGHVDASTRCETLATSGNAGSEPVTLERMWALEPCKAPSVNTLKLFLLSPNNLFSSRGFFFIPVEVCVHAFGACALVPTDLHKTMVLKWVNILRCSHVQQELEVLTCPNKSGIFA